MSDIAELEKRALEIRSLYERLETKRDGQPWSREKLAQGFAKDVADLLAIVNSPELDDKKLQHELADCLWSILVLAQKFDVDLERAFYGTMDELEVRIGKELA